MAKQKNDFCVGYFLSAEVKDWHKDYTDMAMWCNSNPGHAIEECVEEGVKGYRIVPIKEPELIPPTAEQVEANRASAYAQLVDPLHARKTRKSIVEGWSSDEEEKYQQQVKELSASIEANNPYPDETENDNIERPSCGKE